MKMYRVTILGGKAYAVKINSLNDDQAIEDIETLIDEGEHVILTTDLDGLEEQLDIEIEIA